MIILIVVLALVSGLCLMMGGDHNPKASETDMIEVQPLELDFADDAFNGVKKMYKTANNLVKVAKAANDIAKFADVADALSALGPEMAVAGAVITFVGDLFGLDGHSKATLQFRQEMEKLNAIQKGIQQLKTQISNDFEHLNAEISTKDCVEILQNAESQIQAYTSSIKGDTDLYLREHTIREHGKHCATHVITILKFISGQSQACNYFEVIQAGTGPKAIWSDNVVYMQKKYSYMLLLAQQGITCATSHHMLMMKEDTTEGAPKITKDNYQYFALQWYQTHQWGEQFKQAVSQANSLLSQSQQLNQEDDWIQEKLYEIYNSIKNSIKHSYSFIQTAEFIQEQFAKNVQASNWVVIPFVADHMQACNNGHIDQWLSVPNYKVPQPIVYRTPKVETVMFKAIKKAINQGAYDSYQYYDDACDTTPLMTSTLAGFDVGIWFSSTNYKLQPIGTQGFTLQVRAMHTGWVWFTYVEGNQT